MTDINRNIMPITIRPFNSIDHAVLKEVTVDQIPVTGDPIEIDSNMYLICDIHNNVNDGELSVGVIPIVYKTGNVFNTENYLESLSVALRRLQDLRLVYNQ